MHKPLVSYIHYCRFGYRKGDGDRTCKSELEEADKQTSEEANRGEEGRRH